MKSLQGQFLVASAQLLDPNFLHTVVLILQHNDDGAMGVVLNRPTHTTMAEVWAQVSPNPCSSQATLYRGGPCDGPLVVLHTHEQLAQIEVLPGLYCSMEASSVETLVEMDCQPIRFFVGYAGWGPGQLESELVESSWAITSAGADPIFNTAGDLWVSINKVLSRSIAFPHVDPRHVPPDPSVN